MWPFIRGEHAVDSRSHAALTPEGDDGSAIDQVDEGLVRKVAHPLHQPGEHLMITALPLGRCPMEGDNFLAKGLQLDACILAFAFGGASPGDRLAGNAAIPVDALALLVALRDGQVPLPAR